MTDDSDLEGLDPYDIMDAEAARLDRFFAGLDADAWMQPSRCEGWSVRDVLAHLLASEGYNAASLDGKVAEFLAAWSARGVTDLSSANEFGIRELDARSTGEHRSYSNVVLAGAALEKHLEGRQQQHEERRVVPIAQRHECARKFSRKQYGLYRSGKSLPRRARVIRGDFQSWQIGKLPAPVADLCG